MQPELPQLGHIENLRKITVSDPLVRTPYIPRGKHLLIGQRKNRGKIDALVFLGKCIEETKISNKYDANVWLDIRTPHIIYICGKRGSGKSYDLGILAEGLMLNRASKVTTKEIPLTAIIFDTQNQFWSLNDAPKKTLVEDGEQLEFLRQWDLPPTKINNIKLFKPKGENTDLPSVNDFVIDPIELDIDDWCGLFGLERYSPQGECIRSLLNKVGNEGYEIEDKSRGHSKNVHIPPKQRYGINDLINCLLHDLEMLDQSQRQTRDAVLWKLESVQGSNLFQSGGINIRDILQPGQLSIFLLRNLDNATKALVVGVLGKRILSIMGDYHTRRKIGRRLNKPLPPEYSNLPDGIWILIDEAHIICPSDAQTAAKPIMIEYVKRGRDAGLSLVLATQQPSAVDSRVISQVDIVIAHRLVVDSDISAALARLPARFPTSISIGSETVSDVNSLIRMLDTREAWVADAESGRAFLIAMRPRVTAHGGDEPVMI
jgi:hypothetical protein